MLSKQNRRARQEHHEHALSRSGGLKGYNGLPTYPGEHEASFEVEEAVWR